MTVSKTSGKFGFVTKNGIPVLHDGPIMIKNGRVRIPKILKGAKYKGPASEKVITLFTLFAHQVGGAKI